MKISAQKQAVCIISTEKFNRRVVTHPQSLNPRGIPRISKSIDVNRQTGYVIVALRGSDFIPIEYQNIWVWYEGGMQRWRNEA